jgi:hypothetical protein
MAQLPFDDAEGPDAPPDDLPPGGSWTASPEIDDRRNAHQSTLKIDAPPTTAGFSPTLRHFGRSRNIEGGSPPSSRRQECAGSGPIDASVVGQQATRRLSGAILSRLS